MNLYFTHSASYLRALFPKRHAKIPQVPEDWKTLVSIRKTAASLFGENRFLSKSDLRSLLQGSENALAHFHTLSESGLLKSYCSKYRIQYEKVVSTLSFFDRISAFARARNRQYVEQTLKTEKDYLDHILDPIDPAIRLDDDQRRMIINDEDYCLVLAGAGAGKTTAVAAKVRYLTERMHINPGEILVISFTNKAVAELKDRIQKNLGIPCPIATFHSTGNAILHKTSPEKVNIADPSLKYTSILAYFQRQVLRDEDMVHRLLLFFSYYLDAPFDTNDPEAFFRNISLGNYETLRSQLGEVYETALNIRNKQPVTICNEIVRSQQEAQIANFLYLNSVSYEYEPIYPYDLPGSGRPYTPDFAITQNGQTWYLEHFGISEDGTSSRYSQQELERYKVCARSKAIFHRRHGTNLIYTYSSYRDGRSLTEHLKELLTASGIVLTPIPEERVLGMLISQEEAKSVTRLVMLLVRFLSAFKTNGYTLDTFDFLRRTQKNVRTQLFLEIARACYLEYERVLQEKQALDFEDMINNSATILRQIAAQHNTGDYSSSVTPDFKYIIVDEYQDISRQRFDLVRALRMATGARIIAVGDDWQSIYAFSGSDISLFTRFRENMGYASLLRIEHTYRNAQEVIDIAGGFIQKNTSQIKKSLKSSRTIKDPMIILTYDPPDRGNYLESGRRDTWFTRQAQAFEQALDEIVAYHNGKEEGHSVLALGRFNFDGYHLSRSDKFTFRNNGSRILSRKYPNLRITFMTAHSSKGLGYDDVVILNTKNERYGFPSKLEDDPLMKLVLKEDHSYDYAEERRLFYVAMTRTKNRVWMIAPSDHPSEFLLELMDDYDNVKLEGHLSRSQANSDPMSKRCPVCGYPMKLHFHKAYGLPLYLCTNEPEVCGFLTNDLAGGRMNIMRCDCCRDGYLIIKRNRKNGQVFWGCTNYLPNGKGCNRTISR